MSIIGSMLSEIPKEPERHNSEPWDIVMIPLDKIVPSPQNFYGLRGIDGLAQSIGEQGLKQPLTVHRVPDSGLYEIESGGRRYEALKLLLSQGNERYRIVPCKIEPDSDKIMSEVRLIEGNARTRQLTDYEKVIQAQRLKALYQARKLRGEKIQGRTRDNMAKDLDVSSSQLSIYESCSNHLIPEAMAEFRDGRLDITAAYEASKLPALKQAEIVEDIRRDGKVDVKAVKKKHDKTASSPEFAPSAPPAPSEPEVNPQSVQSNLELKPCPFCGGSASRSFAGVKYMIFCIDCKAQMQPCLNRNDAYKAWNRRHIGT